MEANKKLQYETGLELDMQKVLMDPTDRETLDSAILDAERRISTRYIGAPQETIDLEVAKAASKLEAAALSLVGAEDPMRAEVMIRNASYLMPQEKTALSKSVRGEVERVETQGIVDGLLSKFGTGDEAEAEVSRLVREKYPVDKADKIMTRYKTVSNERTVSTAKQEAAVRKQQAENWNQVQARFFNTDTPMPTQDELLNMANNGDISWPEYRQGIGWIASEGTRANIEKRLRTEDPERWGGWTPAQQEEAVMKSKGITPEERADALLFLRAGVMDGSMDKETIKDYYADMRITASERDDLISKIGGLTAKQKEFAAAQKRAFNGDLTKIFSKQYFYESDERKELVANAKEEFSAGLLLLDPESKTYADDVKKLREDVLTSAVETATANAESFIGDDAEYKALVDKTKAAARDGKPPVYSPNFRTDNVNLPGGFDDAVHHTFNNEGGYKEWSANLGGKTNMGIIQSTLNAAYKAGIVNHNDIEKLTRDEASAIYKKNYWDPIKGDQLPYGVGFQLFDMGVIHGTGTAIKMLQRVLDVKVTGKMDDATIQAANDVDPLELIEAMRKKQQGLFTSLAAKDPDAPLKGWLNRGKKLADEAAKRVKETQGDKPSLDDLFGGGLGGL
jgi:lysozyme family protein